MKNQENKKIAGLKLQAISKTKLKAIVGGTGYVADTLSTVGNTMHQNAMNSIRNIRA